MEEIATQLPDWALFAVCTIAVVLHFWTKRESFARSKDDSGSDQKLHEVHEIILAKDADGVPKVYVRTDFSDAIRKLVEIQANQSMLMARVVDFQQRQDDKLDKLIDRLAS